MKYTNLFQSNRPGKHPVWSISLLLVILTLVVSACAGPQSTQQGAGAGIPNTGATGMPASPTKVTGQATETTTGPAAVNPQGTLPAPKAYIGLFKENAVAVLDTATNQVLAKIPVPSGPHGLVITPDGRRVYVSSDGDSKVSVIDTSIDRIVNTIEVGKNPHGLAITPDGQLILAAVFGTSQVVFIDPASNAVIGQVSVPTPHNIAITPDGFFAYVAAQKQGSTGLAILDINKETQIDFVPLDKTPRALNFSPDGRWLYFTQAGVDAVQVLDPATNTIINQVPVGASPHHPLFTPDGKAALVVSQGPGQLSILEPGTKRVVGVVTVGKMPHWIAINSQGTTAWVTNEASNDVSVVDIAAGKVTATIPVGEAPRKIVIQPQNTAAEGQPGSNANVFKTSIRGMAFTDPDIHIQLGQTITWVNQDSITHTVTSDNGKWDSGDIQPGKSFSLTLTQPGQYSYHCSIHPFLTGKITVTQ